MKAITNQGEVGTSSVGMKYLLKQGGVKMKQIYGNIIVTSLLLLGVIIMISLFLTTSFAKEKVNYDINAYVKEMQPGWNLGNSFDAVGTDETAWGNPPVTQSLINKVATEGYKSIRIPITFDQRMGSAPNYQIDTNFLQRVTNTVDWALAADLKVMINVHHDSWIWLENGMLQDHDASLARYETIWRQLANHFKNYSSNLMFESINEPRFSTSSVQQSQKYLDQLNSSFYHIVRDSGGNNMTRALVLPTLDTGTEQENLNGLYQMIQELNDPYLISTVHYYGFWPFSVNIAGYTTFEQDTKNDIIQTFDRVHQTFTANGIPVIIGEFGLLGFDTSVDVIEQGEKLKYFEYMMHYAQAKNFTHMFWDNGQHLGRESLQWGDPQLSNMMKASWETRSATAEADFIYLKKDESIQDESLDLSLNGNTFQSLRYNDQALHEGTDYTITNDKLVLKKHLLEQLVANKIGLQGELTATFNQGTNWYIQIILYAPPILQRTQGTINNFTIPVIFNGNKLATMEAVYAYGSPAGPQNWTSYKEFGYTFTPSYNENKITITSNFFNEVHDGEVHLTFHFWSGDQIKYKILKSGQTVSGFTML